MIKDKLIASKEQVANSNKSVKSKKLFFFQLNILQFIECIVTVDSWQLRTDIQF